MKNVQPHQPISVNQRRVLRRLKILAGQIQGLHRLVEAGTYCPDLIIQSLSIQESLKSFNSLLLENHLRTHVQDQLARHQIDQVVEELLTIYKLNQKR